jgi:hypothetical protein
MSFVLGPNQYGKAEVRVVAVDRSRPQHRLVDLNVSTSLRGDFTAAHTRGDNAHVLATDTQKNTVFAFARDGVGSPEAFALDWPATSPAPTTGSPGPLRLAVLVRAEPDRRAGHCCTWNTRAGVVPVPVAVPEVVSEAAPSRAPPAPCRVPGPFLACPEPAKGSGRGSFSEG